MDAQGRIDNRKNWHHTDDLHAPQGKGDPFAAAMRSTRMAMLITDPNQPDNPIVFANDAFLQLSGYERDDIIGRNCRFLQGADTDPAHVDAIRDAVRNKTDGAVEILNYRKDGTTFWNALFLSPVIDESGNLLYFFASQIDVTARRNVEAELESQRTRFETAVRERTKELEHTLEVQKMLVHEVDHRVKNNLQLVSSLVLMQTREISDPAIRASLTSMQERIEALGTVHNLLYQADDARVLSVADLVRDLATGLVASSGRNDIELKLDLDEVRVRADMATPISLIFNELVTNALKHAFPDGRSGQLMIRVKENAPGLVLEVEDNGVGMARERRATAFGTKLMDALARQLHSRIEWSSATPGTIARLRIETRT